MEKHHLARFDRAGSFQPDEISSCRGPATSSIVPVPGHEVIPRGITAGENKSAPQVEDLQVTRVASGKFQPEKDLIPSGVGPGQTENDPLAKTPIRIHGNGTAGDLPQSGAGGHPDQVPGLLSLVQKR